MSKGAGGVTGCIYDPAANATGAYAGAYADTGRGPDGGGWAGAENCSTGTQVRKTPSWPRSWANLSLL